jgi:carboxylate-amine ligase
VSARRQGVNGLHVHVGMPGPEECLHILENILPWLPLVLALSANSPYLNGEETGHLSFRAEILGLLPRRGAPPRFETYADWERFIGRLVQAGTIADYTQIWWDARIHPRFGTLEIRAPDQPTWLRHTAAFVALLQTLCAYALTIPRRNDGPGSRAVYDQNRWAASRYGTEAELVHPDEDRMVPVPELTNELLERLRPAARALGNEELLATIDPMRCEAERQLEIGRERGLQPLLQALAERTLAFD